ncbi:MAG: TIGR02584 family CRISPR-associated protein [Candidatus Electrothrix sp. GM3_4]|nr:TIGR02584 family CRISPR-associated protein [Candidatus Electrothrix sp. GM3_4]
MPQPHEYSRRILLAVIGMTPQILTETLYKLVVDSNPPFIPTEIHLITTAQGAKSAQNALLGVGGDKGEFHRFCQDYNLSTTRFTPDHIHRISGPDGPFINDTESAEHNTITANFITEQVRRFTEDDQAALHLSLAGGRKTMSYYAGYALSLYGRMQDRLSHVLVAFLQRKSKLKKAVVSVLGERAARPFLIQTVEVDGRAGYVIGMEPGNIVVG